MLKIMEDISIDILRELYRVMLKIRRFEEKLIELYPAQGMKTPVHLYIGEEAVASGVCINLSKDDYIFSTHRCHGHYVAKGGDLKKAMAEMYGKSTGCCKGKGGSMHLVDPEAGVCGSTAIVGGNIPLAVGMALGLVMQGKNNVAVSFFGDGAVDQGTFHESLNFAALKRLPIVFICENNFYATCSHQSARQPLDNIYRRGEIYGIPGVRVDGNDVVGVYKAAKEVVDRARNGGGPTLIEARTYRWKGHVGPDSDIKLGYRSQEELDRWMERCPVKLMEQKLIENKLITKEEMGEISGSIDKELNEAVIFGKESEYPLSSDVLEDLWG